MLLYVDSYFLSFLGCRFRLHEDQLGTYEHDKPLGKIQAAFSAETAWFVGCFG